MPLHPKLGSYHLGNLSTIIMGENLSRFCTWSPDLYSTEKNQMFFIKSNSINFTILLRFNSANICSSKYTTCTIVHESNEPITMYGIIYIYLSDGSLLSIITYKNDQNIFTPSYRRHFFIRLIRLKIYANVTDEIDKIIRISIIHFPFKCYTLYLNLLQYVQGERSRKSIVQA